MKNPVLFSFLFAGALCSAAAEGPAPSVTKTNLPACCLNKKMEAGKITDQSLYQLDSKWTSDAGTELKLDALKGRPQVVTMFFANCVYACPILVHDMKKIEAALPKELQGEVGFTLVSFDSERDTTKVLAAFRKTHKLPPNWSLLRGKPDDVLELAALLGVKFKKEPNGQYAHSNIISVLNAKGEIVFQKLGLNTDAADTAAAIKKAVDSCNAHPES